MSPSPFVLEWLERIARSSDSPMEQCRQYRALDLAMGTGRHARALAQAGFRTFGVDISFDAVRSARASLVPDERTIAAWVADLRQYPLPRSRFDVIVVTRYLQRDLFGAISEALAPGGVLIYETFTTRQRMYERGPTSPDHLLEPGELRRAFDALDVLFYEEVSAPEAVARIAGRRATRRS
jgi:tellurite methyltransferase